MSLIRHSTMFLARLAELPGMRGFVEQFCTEIGLGRDTCLRLNLVIEELFTNTVRHGHRGDSDAPVWITLVDRAGGIDIDLEDTAPPFNPFAHVELPLHQGELRKIGGLGVLLARELTLSREYAYIFGRNRIHLRLPHSP